MGRCKRQANFLVLGHASRFIPLFIPAEANCTTSPMCRRHQPKSRKQLTATALLDSSMQPFFAAVFAAHH